MILTCETCQTTTVEVEDLLTAVAKLDDQGWRLILIPPQPPRAFCPACVEKARTRRLRLHPTTHATMIVVLERLLAQDVGVEWYGRLPSFLFSEEREALAYALGVLHARTPEEDPF